MFSLPGLLLVRACEPERIFYSLEAASHLTGVHADMLTHYCRIGLLGEARVQPDAELTFDDDALYTIRRIEHFRRQHGVNLSALPLVCAMAEALGRQAAELRFLRNR